MTKINQNPSNSEVKVNVNGQDIPVPESGTVQKQINTEDGNTTVQVNVNNQTNGDSKSSSNRLICVFSQTAILPSESTNQMNVKEVSR